MSDAIKTISVLIMAIALLVLSYLFYVHDEGGPAIILMFVGIVLALALANSLISFKKKR